ncbi:MAG TPA: hypothetical protein VGI10_13340 [Polyangiaceae bacterium]
MIGRAARLSRRAFAGRVALACVAWSALAFAGSYLNSAALLLAQALVEAEYLRARINDRELAELVHRLADARLDAAKGMLVPKEVALAHPHLLLVLENYERAADAATRGGMSQFLVYQQRARDEDRTFRGVLKQLGYSLPETKPSN